MRIPYIQTDIQKTVVKSNESDGFLARYIAHPKLVETANAREDRKTSGENLDLMTMAGC
jgi:hypothetical protein